MPNVNRLYNFDSGEYGIDNLSQANKKSLKEIFDDIQAKLQANPKTQYELIIQGSESLVTNPPGFERKGSLGDARSETIKQYYTENYPIILTPNRVLRRIDPSKIGLIPYTSSIDNPLAQKYKDDQYVEITFQPYIRITQKNPCLINTTPVSKTQPDIPPSLILWSETYDFPPTFIEGEFELTFESNRYPDAIEMEFLNEERVKTKSAFIPLHASKPTDIPFTISYLDEMYPVYKKYPNSKAFQYLPIISSSGAPDRFTNLRNANLWGDFNSIFNPSTFMNFSKYKGGYDVIPLYSRPGTDISNYPDGVPRPEIIRIGDGEFKSKITLQKTENDKKVTLRVYGYIPNTVFNYSTRCIPRTT